MKKQTKRGFTIVELVVVIAIIAILAAILIPTFSNVIKRANISRDTQLIRNLNTALVVDSAKNGTHTTMQSALDAAEQFGYDVSKINKSATDNEILWDSVNDVFCYYNADSTEENKIEYIPEFPGAKDANPVDYFVISNEIDDTYSTYLFGYEGDSAVTITKGLDVGNTTTINSISYTNTAAQTVVIRTNSANTTLTINAEHDTVNHYGKVGKVDAQKIGMDCYNEYGTAAYVKVTEGKVVAKAGGSIAVVFAANNDKDAVAVIKETNGTIERGLTVIEPVSTTNEARTNGIPLEYSIDGVTAESKSEEELSEELETRTTAVEAIAQEAINEAKAKEAFAGVSIAKEGEETILMTLADFRDSVNDGNSYAGYTVTLMNDIDLGGVEWTPIGTTEHPFSGVFDGQNHKIMNLTYDGAPTGQMLGLFGEVKGTKNDSAMTLTSVWSNDTFNETGVSEHQYTAVIKNVILTGFNITNRSSDGSTRYTGALAGRMDDAYISNVTVSNSTIKGTKGVGGLVGSFNGSTAKNCRTLSGVNVEAIEGGYNIGGLFGGTNYSNHGTQTYYGAIIYCENNAAVTIPENGAEKGYIGGIVGLSQSFVDGNSPSSSGFVFINCTNNGKIEAKTSIVSGVGGIAGFGQNAVAFVGCINTGNISANVADNIAGISYGGNQAINCSNSGQLTASAAKMAGVYIDYTGQTGGTGLAYGCVNSGTLVNSNTSGCTAEVTICGNVLTFKNQTYADVNAIIAVLNTNEAKTFEFIDCTVADNSGTLTLGDFSSYIYANNPICSNVSITSGKASLNIPNAAINVPANATLDSFSSMGENCTITIESGATVQNVTVGGNGTSLIVNGTVSDKIIMAGEGAVTATISADASAGRINFGGTGTYTLTNRGTISHTQSEGNNSANEHTVSTIKACNITINNYGTIKAGKNGNNKCSYAMLFYNGSSVVVNQYPGSQITADNNGYLLACSSANSVVYQTYDENGTLTETVNKK